jgi:8-oxo-dGTP pyrophosphatase MutT (NUDIX family)
MPKSVPRKEPPPSKTPAYSKEISAMAWIEDINGNVLFVKQAQVRRLWTLPGGKVKRGESLIGALKREVLEETGYAIRRCVPIDLFDRPKKGNLTILFRVLVQPKRRPLTPRADAEIENVQFKRHLPRNSTPSARYFWRRAQDSFDPLSLIR